MLTLTYGPSRLVEELDQLRPALVLVPDAAEVERQFALATDVRERCAPRPQQCDCIPIVVSGLEGVVEWRLQSGFLL